ncbi:hypothetical protein ElyMa_004109000 [Elysia marginata]|uniref:Uncharacterized protein n=1 Tax=Elysia marginata TaxID=1093978 RepID=A0AAV4GB74_9GAST|nr:hypothetical protein ElyMa_004109000 [Elysia marginata]
MLKAKSCQKRSNIFSLYRKEQPNTKKAKGVCDRLGDRGNVETSCHALGDGEEVKTSCQGRRDRWDTERSCREQCGDIMPCARRQGESEDFMPRL